MNCPLCGEVCHCQLEPLPSALSQWSPEPESGPEASSAAATELQGIDPDLAERPTGEGSGPNPSGESISAADSEAIPEVASAPAWRDELSDRLSRYRSRRKVRPPRYPSLALKFEAQESSASGNSPRGSSLPEYEAISNHALALDGLRREPSTAVDADVAPHPSVAETARQPNPQTTPHVGAKIIEFPRFAWGPPPPPPDQLAEPVSERPRILEVPEVAPPPPALGGITIEAAEQPDSEKRPGIDIPLQSAPLGLRVVAALVDGLIIATASALFGFIFWKLGAVRPPLPQILGLAVGIPCVFWAAYEYLLIVYAASTPGLRVTGLELARFDGSSTTRSLRRWRVFAAYLSAVSAGMGFVWVFLDEDALCWHDRITHTYLAPGKPQGMPLPTTGR